MKITIWRVRLGTEEYRVISPATPLRNGALYDRKYGYHMYVDRPDGHRIALLWLLAARSRRSLVYLPLRGTPHAPGVDVDMSEPGWTLEWVWRPLDLVLVHHSVQFPPSRWTQVRERITAGNAPREVRTARIPATELPSSDGIDDPAFDYRNNRDILRPRVHAETLFLTGSAPAFRTSVRPFFTVTRQGPPAAAGDSLYIPGSCNYHVCAGVSPLGKPTGYGNRRDSYSPYIHLEYCPSWSQS